MYYWDDDFLMGNPVQESYVSDPTSISAQAKGARVFTVPGSHQELTNAIWEQLILACDGYFYNGITEISGDEDAPYMDDEKINDQFNYFDLYMTDSGALMWGIAKNEGGKVSYEYTNRGRTPYVFSDLPMNIKRALCQRIWKLCKNAELEKNHIYINGMQRMRNDL